LKRNLERQRVGNDFTTSDDFILRDELVLAVQDADVSGRTGKHHAMGSGFLNQDINIIVNESVVYIEHLGNLNAVELYSLHGNM
jgi:hypothetical protein